MEVINYENFIDPEYETSTDSEEQDSVPLDDAFGQTFLPRCYQEELFEFAKEKNSIMVLGTGSGKTFISILLIKELAEAVRGKLCDGAKRTVFLVNTVPLVYQQAEAISKHTGFSVGKYEGSMGVDIWSEEKWNEELNKHEILVMVAQIFKDLILHNFLSLDKINLLIMDECHHATGKHPMREVMREYNKLKCDNMQVPRVMGLTACVIHRKCNVREIRKYMNDLENVMDSVLVTSRDQETVKQFTTRPKEMVLKSPTIETSKSYEVVVNQLMKIKNVMHQKINRYSFSVQMQLKKFVSKEIDSIINVSNDLGEYILAQAIKLQAEYLKQAETDTTEEQEVLLDLGRLLENIPLDSLVYDGDINRYVSGKVKKLIELLTQCEDKDIATLVFVTRRNTAKLLCYLLLKLKECNPRLAYLLPECVVGGIFNMKVDLKTKEEILKQKKTIDNFRKGLCNIIVSTSVLEEGIDVRKCNLVIRFDAPINYRSYIQSLGRARAIPSYFITLTNETEYEDVLNNRICFRKIHEYLNVLCHDRELPTTEAARSDFDSDELEPPFAPYGIPGPQITFNSAIQLINRYCGTLPQDKFTKLTVTVKKWVDNERYYVSLTLPINSPWRNAVTSKPMDNYENAKKSAAFEMCKLLFNHNVFNNNLLPKKSKVESEEILNKYLDLKLESIPKNKPQPGTRKRRQIYKRKLCSSFQKNTTTKFLLYRVYFQHINSVKEELLLDTDILKTQLGFICKGELNTASFPLFSKKWGEVNIVTELIGPVTCTSGEMEKIKTFHKVASSFLYKLNLDIMNFDHDEAGHSVYIVPLAKNNFDVNKLTKISNMNIENFEDISRQLTNRAQNGFHFDEENFQNGVVIPNYRDFELFYVITVLKNNSPLSPFPSDKNIYSSYKDYMKKKYGAEVYNDDQPLVECKTFSKEFNYLEVTRPATKTTRLPHPVFVPEMCVSVPFTATFCCQLHCMASVLHRINGLEIEQELYKSVGYNCKEEAKWMFKNNCLDYYWVKETVQFLLQGECDNICLRLQNDRFMTINPGMILQALTPLHTKESFNLERLELLGDSYLKFSVGNYLFCKEITSHEGDLTIQRSHIVSNKTLYTLAKKRDLGSLFQGVLLNPVTCTPFGFSVKEEVEQELVIGNVPTEEWISYKKSSPKTASTNAENDSEEVYNPWTEQLVPDKSLADAVEALIGVYLLCGGEKAANHFMAWLGLPFIQEVVEVPKTAIFANIDQEEAYCSVRRLYKKNCLDRLEDLIGYTFNEKSFLVQAFTHPSFDSNKVTDCYQRLEFFGDAILDFIITGYIFTHFNGYSPGQLTDLRSHYVKNETLARVAVKFGLHRYLMHKAPKLTNKMDLFIKMVEDGEREFNTEDETLENEDIEVPKSLGDIVEALICAVFMDSEKSLPITWNLIKLLLKDEFEATKTNIPIDTVRELYEKYPNIEMKYFDPTEEESAKCVVKIPGFKELTGTGKNKRTAKQAAAKLALNHLKHTESVGQSSTS